jgi:hypothetical protein
MPKNSLSAKPKVMINRAGAAIVPDKEAEAIVYSADLGKIRGADIDLRRRQLGRRGRRQPEAVPARYRIEMEAQPSRHFRDRGANIAGHPVERSKSPTEKELPTERLLERLQAIEDTLQGKSNQLQWVVELLRSREVSWAVIGAALDISRQSAWERFT